MIFLIYFLMFFFIFFYRFFLLFIIKSKFKWFIVFLSLFWVLNQLSGFGSEFFKKLEGRFFGLELLKLGLSFKVFFI